MGAGKRARRPPRWLHWSGLACPAAAFTTGAAPTRAAMCWMPGTGRSSISCTWWRLCNTQRRTDDGTGPAASLLGRRQGEDHRRHGPCPPRTGQRQTGGHRAVPQGRAERRDSSAGPAGGKNFPGQGRAEVRVPDERSGKGRCPGRAERKPDRRTGRACRPAYFR